MYRTGALRNDRLRRLLDVSRQLHVRSWADAAVAPALWLTTVEKAAAARESCRIVLPSTRASLPGAAATQGSCLSEAGHEPCAFSNQWFKPMVFTADRRCRQ